MQYQRKDKTKLDNKKDNLNFNYKKISDDEILFDNVHNTNEKDFNKKEIITEMIKGNISDLVKNQLNINKRDDLQEKAYTDSENHTNVNKKTNWFAEYKKQTITVTKEKIRAYLKNYKDLDKLIKYFDNISESTLLFFVMRSGKAFKGKFYKTNIFFY